MIRSQNEQRDLCLRFDRSVPHLSVYMQQNSSGLIRRINYFGYLPFNIEVRFPQFFKYY